jgi:hypothetical protein
MRIAKFGVGAAAVAALVVLASARPTGAQDPGRTCMPFFQIIPDMCTGEDIAITGEACMDVFVHFDASGGAHATAHETITGTGMGLTSGNQYVFHTEVNAEENANLGNNAQFEATMVSYATLISKGSMPNERATFTTHTTINANGTVTSIDTDVTDNCSG